MQRMGQMAMESLFKLMSGDEEEIRIKVDPELIVRESTARIRTA
jgi:DNA-binding LacI/PurR family transcriptional regulator